MARFGICDVCRGLVAQRDALKAEVERLRRQVEAVRTLCDAEANLVYVYVSGVRDALDEAGQP